VAGGFAAIQYVNDIVQADELMVSIDLGDIHVT
jgi:hypothetical protein